MNKFAIDFKSIIDEVLKEMSHEDFHKNIMTDPLFDILEEINGYAQLPRISSYS